MISRSFRVALSAFLFVGALGLASTGPVQAQSIMKQCGDEWKAAKENNTTNGMKWPDFLKQCRVQKEGAATRAALLRLLSPLLLHRRPPLRSRRLQPISRSRNPCKRLARPARANSARRRKPRGAARAIRWSGSTPRASPIPTITRVPAGTARPSRAPICVRPTLGPPAITRRRARRNSRSRCSRDRGLAARKLRGRHSVHGAWAEANCIWVEPRSSLRAIGRRSRPSFRTGYGEAIQGNVARPATPGSPRRHSPSRDGRLSTPCGSSR